MGHRTSSWPTSCVTGMCRPARTTRASSRIIEKAVAALPGKFDKIHVRVGSALYEHDAVTRMDELAIGYVISAEISPQLKECIEALPEDHWRSAGEESDAIREWAGVNCVPCDGNWSKDSITPRRYLAIRMRLR